MIYRFLFLSLTLFFLTSCSQNKSESYYNVTIEFAQAEISTLGGGIILFGTGPDGRVFSKSVSPLTGSVNISLRGGDWNIFAYGIKGTVPLTGSARCGYTAKNIGKSEEFVEINLSAASCSHPSFGDSSSRTQLGAFKGWHMNPCHLPTLQTAASTTCSQSSNIASYVISFFEYPDSTMSEAPVIGQSGLSSLCLQASSSGAPYATGLALPFPVNAQTPIAYRILSFSDASCTSLVGVHLVHTRNVLGPLNTNTAIGSDSSNVYFFLKGSVAGPAFWDMAMFDASIWQ